MTGTIVARTEGAVEAAGALSETLRLATSAAHKKKWGQYLTSPPVARFMAGLLDAGAMKRVRVLDPGAGTGTLGVAVVEHLLAEGVDAVELLAVEREPQARQALTMALENAKQVYGNRFDFSVSEDDFLGFADPELGRQSPEPFDLVISNPPYFKMPPSEHRGGDSPNIYTRFMEVASRLLRDGGTMCFIIPRSFASGLYFRRFRRDFHARMALERVHVFDSRREAFKGEGVLQENIIVRYRKQPSHAKAKVLVSSSAGSADLDAPRELSVPLARVIDHKDRNAILSLPTTDDDLRVMDFLEAWPSRLADHGLEVSTGPVVPFRSKAWLRTEAEPGTTVPLLWMQHVRNEGVVFPRPGGFRKPEYISTSAPAKMLVPNQNYILLRRFSSKEEAKRLTASVYLSGQCEGDVLGLENHLNFIHRPGGSMSRDEVQGLAALLNSDLLDRYFRISNGNTQVNATEMRAMPLPRLDEIKAIGARLVVGSESEPKVLEEVLDM